MGKKKKGNPNKPTPTPTFWEQVGKRPQPPQRPTPPIQVINLETWKQKHKPPIYVPPFRSLTEVPIDLPPKPVVELVDDNSPNIPTSSNTNLPKNPTSIITTTTANNIATKMGRKKNKLNKQQQFIAAKIQQLSTVNQIAGPLNQLFDPVAGPVQNAGLNPVQKVGPKPAQKAGPKTAQKAGQKPAQKAGPNPAQKAGLNPVQKAGLNPAQKVGPNPAQKAGLNPAQKVGLTAQKFSPTTDNGADKAAEIRNMDPSGDAPDQQNFKLLEPPKSFTNQQKKKWLQFQNKLQKKYPSKNLSWTKADNPATGGTSDTPQNPEANQCAPSNETQAPNPAPTVTVVTNTSQAIPTLEPRVQDILLKTKKHLQSEMARQRQAWIKADTNTIGTQPGVSGIPQNRSQVTPPIQPQAGEAAIPGFTTSDPNVPQAMTQRSTASNFFKPGVQQPQPSPKRGGSADKFSTGTYMCYPKGIPKSFLIQQQNAQENNQAIAPNAPIWPNMTPLNYGANMPTMGQTSGPTSNENNMNAPIFVETGNQVDIQQQYSPSDVYAENTNPEPPEEQELSDQHQTGQKRLSAFQRLGPLSQPKKPKLTINLQLNKEQPVREVVKDTDDDPDRYTPVHLRQDIIKSTDETVMKYLTSWPWRKNVGIRRRATARNSRSVMILEQEQMEEVYEKDNLFILISVKGYPSTWTKEHVLDTILDSVRGYSLIPCFTEFYQHECKFLTLRSRSALIILHKTGFYIHKDGVELTITISHPDLSLNQIDFIPRIILRKRMAMGYTESENKLNLSAFTLQDDISHFIYFPLSRLSNQSEFIQLQSVIAWDHLTDLDLSHNRLTDISGFDLNVVAPRLKHLNLSHNYLEKVTVLIAYRSLPLKTIRLEGNPLCNDYTDPEHYVKVVRMMFPAVIEIDGVPIHRSGELPQIKQNYCPDEAKEVAEKFLEIYFPLLDSGPENRSLVQGMYEDDAILTITYCYKLRYAPIYRCFRNLFLYARFLDEGETDSVMGAMSITKLINRWPHTEHDPYTFTVDVLYHTETTTIIRIGGLLKLTAETLAEDEHLLAFTRTVVLYSDDGDEYRIQNEMIYWDEPTAAAARSAFRINTISQKKINLKIESTTDEDLQEKFLQIFMKLTTMDKNISERCLEMNNWNFKLALEHFTKLLKTNNLDSLNKEVPAE